MKTKAFLLIVILLVCAIPVQVYAVVAAFNADIHMDIPDRIANDFHVQGRIKSGFIGSNWTIPPVLVHHIDGGFPDFSYSIMPDYTSPDENEFIFHADWNGKDFHYCEILHLGLMFDLTCNNIVVDLTGWWTFDGERIWEGRNGGAVLLPGFNVIDQLEGQRDHITIRNDSQMDEFPIGGRVLSMDLAHIPRDAVEEMGGTEAIFERLNLEGQDNFNWLRVVQGAEPFSSEFPPDSFFDVFFEIEIPDPHPVSPIEINPGDILIGREEYEFPGNGPEPEVRWIWHMHEAHDMDFGDAPDPTYPTLLLSNGACHIIRGPWLGDRSDVPDGEPDGQPDPLALGDDNDIFFPPVNDDEDGVSIPVLTPGQMATITVTVNGGTTGVGGGIVDAWIDFDQSGMWDAAEQIYGGYLPAGVHNINIPVPAGIPAGQSFARFRISRQGGLPPDGFCDNGEVEDHLVNIKEEQYEWDFGDAPKTYPTLLAVNGARHFISGPWFGDASDVPDGEPDGQPELQALGDDKDILYPPVNDDEDGVMIPPLVAGQTANVTVIVSGASAGTLGAFVDAWIDFNADGDWYDAGEMIFSGPLPNGTQMIPVAVPANSTPGQSFARFRISSQGGLSPEGLAEDGEVEDHEVKIEEDLTPRHDLGDAPDSSNTYGLQMTAFPDGTIGRYPTVFTAGSPYHGPLHLDPTGYAFLGQAVSMENEADVGPDQDPTNNLDPQNDVPDLDTADDCLAGPVVIRSCDINTFKFDVTFTAILADVPLYVNVWFDWNMDGDWDDMNIICPDGGQVNEWAVQNQQIVAPGIGTYTYQTNPFLAWWPDDPVSDATWMRITLSERPWDPIGDIDGQGGSGPSSGYQYGETEDYFVIPEIILPEYDFGDAPDPTFPTLMASNGARHLLGSGLFMGSSVDPDGDGQPTSDADGDDVLDGSDDEDGVDTSILVPGQGGHADIYASQDAYVNAWIDFNADGDWDDPGERIAANVSVVAGLNTINFQVPGDAAQGRDIFARFRISFERLTGYDGPAQSGEVEDYKYHILSLDYGDAPNRNFGIGYPTVLLENGARHIIDPDIYLGSQIDPDPDGMPTMNADGDDISDGTDDEDGVKFLTWPLVPGKPAKIEVVASQDALLGAWIDFGDDGSWNQPGDAVYVSEPVVQGSNIMVFNVPLTAKANSKTYARFRLTTSSQLMAPIGLLKNGEVEDYVVKTGESCGVKWVQQPDDTPFGIDIQVDDSGNIMRNMADDFLCTSVDKITDVHLWGSWLDDIKGRIVGITLSIYSDDPVGPEGPDPDNEYSKPDKMLWTRKFGAGEFKEKEFITLGSDEGEYWWDPVEGLLIPDADNTIWQVDILIPEESAFQQEGTEDDPIVYWLEVAVDTEEGSFGWKTRKWPMHFNDDAVISVGSELPRIWKELIYPVGHPYNGVTFEDLNAGDEYAVPGTIMTAGVVSIEVMPFEHSTGTLALKAMVDDKQMSGGTGLDINTNNVDLDFNFGLTLYSLTAQYGEYGGEVNLSVNGDLRIANNFSDLDGQIIGGVKVSVFAATGITQEIGRIHLDGKIDAFAIGGQELWIDNIGSRSIDMAFALTNQKYCPRDADLNCDGIVDLLDFAIFSSQWMTTKP